MWIKSLKYLFFYFENHVVVHWLLLNVYFFWGVDIFLTIPLIIIIIVIIIIIIIYNYTIGLHSKTNALAKQQFASIFFELYDDY